MASELAGRVILVTRPREQAARLTRLIEEVGGRAVLFPAIEIEDLSPPAALRRLQDYDLAVFVSPTAVSKVFAHVHSWPTGLRAAAVGAGTRRELERHGLRGVISPNAGADSEALLAAPSMPDVRGTRIVVFRGEDGRALLGETLRERGAQVEYAACYRRVRPKSFNDPGSVDAITVSSAEGLANLFEMLGPARVCATPLFVPHVRIADEARSRNAKQVLLAAGASDEQMRDRLVAYFARHE